MRKREKKEEKELLFLLPLKSMGKTKKGDN